MLTRLLEAGTAAAAVVLFSVAVADASDFPSFDDPHLAEGQRVWEGTCMACHAYGIAGAPDPRDPELWAPRLAQGKSVLYEHALNGFFGPDDTMMPERGGNLELSDEEVKAAVDYMAAVAAQAIEAGK